MKLKCELCGAEINHIDTKFNCPYCKVRMWRVIKI